MIDDEATPAGDPLMRRWLQKLVPGSRRRAARVGRLHDLAEDHGRRLFEWQGGVCAISGLPFSLTQFPGVLVKHPFAPSLIASRPWGLHSRQRSPGLHRG